LITIGRGSGGLRRIGAFGGVEFGGLLREENGSGLVGEAALAHEPANELLIEVAVLEAEGLLDFAETRVGETLGPFRVQFFGDVGPFGPGPEFVISQLAGLFGFEMEAVAFEGKALGLKIVATQTIDIGIELMEDVEAGFGVGFIGQEGAGGGGDVDGGPPGDFVIEAIGENVVAEGGLIGETVDDAEGILAEAPVVVTAVLPFSEIGGGDGPAAEMFAKDLLNLGEVIQPIENGIGGFTVV
jgi:hypothetical protein